MAEADVGVVVPIAGNHDYWMDLAVRAVRSATAQTVLPRSIVVATGRTVAEARNAGARDAGTGWLVFLDADDELDARYVEAMLAGEGDVRQPATLGVTDGVEDDAPVLIPPARNLLERNHLVIGSMVRSELFFRVGGFDEYPVLEDWALWIKCWLAGATFGQVPGAVYRVHIRPGSRNTQAALHNRTYTQIRQRFRAEAAARGLLQTP